MEKEFVPYEQALALKELGFNEPCFTWYWDDIGLYKGLEYGNHNKRVVVSAPTFSQAFKFFREKYKLYPEIGLHDREDEKTWRLTISILGYYELVYNQNVGKEPYYKTYEETESACLIKLIEIVKNK